MRSVIRAGFAAQGRLGTRWLKEARAVLEGAWGEGIGLVEVDHAPDLRLIAGEAAWVEALVRQSREAGDPTPTVVLNVAPEKGSSPRILDAGADDCLACPFDPTELCARVRAVMRRLARALARFSDIAVERATLHIRVRNVETRVSRMQFELFVCLAERRQRWVHTDEIIALVSGAHHHPKTSLVRVQVCALRKALRTERACIRSNGRKSYMLTLAAS